MYDRTKIVYLDLPGQIGEAGRQRARSIRLRRMVVLRCDFCRGVHIQGELPTLKFLERLVVFSSYGTVMVTPFFLFRAVCRCAAGTFNPIFLF